MRTANDQLFPRENDRNAAARNSGGINIVDRVRLHSKRGQSIFPVELSG